MKNIRNSFSNQETRVRQSVLRPEQDFILTLEPEACPENLSQWVVKNREWLNRALYRHGAIHFHGFNLSPEDFRSISDVIAPDEVPYLNGATPREKFSDGLYLASSFPKELTLPQHHEMSYMRRWPMKVLFYCDIPASSGGATPICSTRTFMNRLSPKIIKNFRDRQVMYLRNYSEGLTSDWRKAFMTESREVVERNCVENDIAFEWREGDRLRTWGVSQGLASHPVTNELLWHNHAINFTFRSDTRGAVTPTMSMMAPGFSKELREQILSSEHSDLATNTYYGDKGFIEQSVLEEISGILEQEKVCFQWNKGDFVLLDNMLTFHGRNPFEGERRILATLKEPFDSRLPKILRAVG